MQEIQLQSPILGEGRGYPLQYSCLENPMDRGAWQAIVHGVAKEAQLSDKTMREKQMIKKHLCYDLFLFYPTRFKKKKKIRYLHRLQQKDLEIMSKMLLYHEYSYK